MIRGASAISLVSASFARHAEPHSIETMRVLNETFGHLRSSAIFYSCSSLRCSLRKELLGIPFAAVHSDVRVPKWTPARQRSPGDTNSNVVNHGTERSNP